MNTLVVYYKCETCPKDPIEVSVTYKTSGQPQDLTITCNVPLGKFSVFADNRQGAGASTDVTNIVIDGTPLVKDGNGNFPSQNITVKDSSGDYVVRVERWPEISIKQNPDKTIVGISMQDPAKNKESTKTGKADTVRHFSVENKCFSCKKDPLNVVVFYEGGYPVSGSAPFGGKQNDIPDDRPNSGASTDVENIIVESQQVDRLGGLFIPTPINVRFNGKVYPVTVNPLHPKTNQNKDKTILGIEMQDGVLIEGEKKAKMKVKKIEKKKAKKSGSKKVKAKKAGKKS